ncbi:MAG: hypothetical protein JNL75_09870 [Chitinophagales bacterium]|nr:hypothetical protein [Chitinophagales bacterium]
MNWRFSCLLVFIFSAISCHLIIPSKRSQLGYQSYDYWELNDSFRLIKFNPYNLGLRAQISKKKTFIVFLHDNRCRGTVCSRNTLLGILNGADSIELIPVVHDYLYDFSKSIRNRYAKEQIIYYTDAKIYGRTINSIKSWNEDVLKKFDPQYNMDSASYNFYFLDSLSGAKFYFYNKNVHSLKAVIDSSKCIAFKL